MAVTTQSPSPSSSAAHGGDAAFAYIHRRLIDLFHCFIKRKQISRCFCVLIMIPFLRLLSSDPSRHSRTIRVPLFPSRLHTARSHCSACIVARAEYPINVFFSLYGHWTMLLMKPISASLNSKILQFFTAITKLKIKTSTQVLFCIE